MEKKKYIYIYEKIYVHYMLVHSFIYYLWEENCIPHLAI